MAPNHLKLEPKRDPGRYILRELWISKTTLLPSAYVIERFVGSPSLFDYPVHITNLKVGDYLVNTALTGTFATQLLDLSSPSGGLQPLPITREASVSFTITDISFPAELPSWLFDPSTYARRKDDPLPEDIKRESTVSPLPSIRQLVYEVTVINGSGTPGRLSSRIALDVVAATDDDGLVVDVADLQTPSASARIGITSSGALLYSSQTSLSPAQEILLSLLGRGVIGPSLRLVGSS